MNLADKTGNRLWAGIFTLVLVLSQDAWLFWDADVLLGPWNLPLRVYYFLGLQFLLAVLLAAFFASLSRREAKHPDRENQ